MLKVFFSYTQCYPNVTREIVDRMQYHFDKHWDEQANGRLEFYDWCQSSVPAGGQLWQELRDQIENSNVFVALIDRYYDSSIARREISEYMNQADKVLIPIFLENEFHESIERLRAELRLLRWLDASDAFAPQNTIGFEQELSDACAFTVNKVLRQTDVGAGAAAEQDHFAFNNDGHGLAQPTQRSGIVVMGASMGNDPQPLRAAREALVTALAQGAPSETLLDLGDDWNNYTASLDTKAKLAAVRDVTPLCLVSVEDGKNIGDGLSERGEETRAWLTQQRFKPVLEFLSKEPGSSATASDLRSVVWLVGRDGVSDAATDEMDFVVGPAESACKEVLRFAGIDTVPFLVEQYGKEGKQITPLVKDDLPRMIFVPPEDAPIPTVFSRSMLEEMLCHQLGGGRKILAITDAGTPPAGLLPTGWDITADYVRGRIASYEQAIEKSRCRGKNIFRLMLQIRSHSVAIGVEESAPNKAVWSILRINPDTGEAKDSDNLEIIREQLNQFLMNPVA